MLLSVGYFLTCALLLASVQCYHEFISHIPSGDSVTHPCEPSQPWHGVGHYNPQGGGHLNPFGHDFQAVGRQWTQELCWHDSDGDGLTNGFELGDPYCQWHQGVQPTWTGNVTHPGIHNVEGCFPRARQAVH
uniref:Temptin Cys/Cys disulfide domain-containing protein n=1 Tax=Biomphalaria glabrata TaxID=6526 RepID=A0A2C9JWV4_BIOGL